MSSVLRGGTARADAVRPLSQASRVKLYARLARPIFTRDPHHANRANDELEPAFLGGKDVLDPTPHPGTGGVAAGNVVRHLLAPGLFALELRPETAALEQGQVGRRAVGGVGPHITGGVVTIEHRAELAAVIGGRIGYRVAP